MAANTPELPHNEGDTFTNEETGIKYEFINGAWRAVSSSASEEVAEALDNIDLEKVLGNGNVADKGILLTDTEDALIALAPEEALIDIASDTSKKNPRIRLTHIDTENYPDSQAQIELDQDGTRVDFEFNQAINDVHFRFDDEEKFVLNKRGDAEFIGKVQGEPGTQNNEFVTYGQLATLEEEIEQLAPSLERGSWNFTLNHPPGPGEYTMISGFLSEEDQQSLCTQEYTQCYADNIEDPIAQQQCSRDLDACKNAVSGDLVLTTNEWSKCEQLVFNPVDSKGVTHEWFGIDSDHFIDVFNESDEGFMIGDISTHGGGSFAFDLVSFKGTANGLASIKIFKTQEEVDFDQYVRKTGDTMTGNLTIKPSSGDAVTLFLKASPEAADNRNVLDIYSNKGSEILWVDSTYAGLGLSARTPTSASHITSKQYVDQVIANHAHSGYKKQALWKAANHQRAADLQVGEFFVADGGNIYFHSKSDNGFDLGVGSSATGANLIMLVSIYSTSGDSIYCITADTITFNNGSNKYIRVQKINERHNNKTITAGTQYALNIPGFTP